MIFSKAESREGDKSAYSEESATTYISSSSPCAGLLEISQEMKQHSWAKRLEQGW